MKSPITRRLTKLTKNSIENQLQTVQQNDNQRINAGKGGLDLWLERNATKAQISELNDIKLSYEAVLEGSRSSSAKSAKLREIDSKRQAIFEQINASNILNNSENDTPKQL